MSIQSLEVDDVVSIVEKPSGWHEGRRAGVGASEASRIMGGDWLELWEEKTGRKEPEDLSGVLAVLMGSWTEPLNLYFFQKQTGIKVVEDKARKQHATHNWMQCELDGWADTFIRAGVECKHVNAFTKSDEVVERYFWQCQHIAAVTDAEAIYLSVIFGNNKWEWFEVPRDDDAIEQLIEREMDFWDHVQTDTQPGGQVAVAAKVSFDDMRVADMTGNNEWGSAAADWVAHQDAKKAFDKADKTLKSLVEADVKRAHGHGVEINRAKNGALRVKEEK